MSFGGDINTNEDMFYLAVRVPPLIVSIPSSKIMKSRGNALTKTVLFSNESSYIVYYPKLGTDNPSSQYVHKLSVVLVICCTITENTPL